MPTLQLTFPIMGLGVVEFGNKGREIPFSPPDITERR